MNDDEYDDDINSVHNDNMSNNGRHGNRRRQSGYGISNFDEGNEGARMDDMGGEHVKNVSNMSNGSRMSNMSNPSRMSNNNNNSNSKSNSNSFGTGNRQQRHRQMNMNSGTFGNPNDSDIDMSNQTDPFNNKRQQQQQQRNMNGMNNMNSMNNMNNMNRQRNDDNRDRINGMNGTSSMDRIHGMNINRRNERDSENESEVEMPARSDAKMYEAKLADLGDEAYAAPVSLEPCPQCGRKFSRDALSKHMRICSKVFGKKRKAFDMSKQRLDDEAQKLNSRGGVGGGSRGGAGSRGGGYNKKASKAAKCKNQSQMLREAIQASRMTEKMLKEGKSLKDIPVQQSSAPDNRVPCPYCNRKFSEEAAERHIPKCKNIKSRPKPMKKARKY